MKQHMISLDDDVVVEKTIARAAEGDSSCAWLLIYQIAEALKERRVSVPLFDYAARFFDALLDVRDQKDNPPTRKELANALDTLHIVRGRGQPETDEDEKSRLAALVMLLHQSRLSIDRAVNALEGFASATKKAYRLAFDEYRASLEMLIPTELEALAKISGQELIDQLADTGALNEAEAQKARSRYADECQKPTAKRADRKIARK